MAQNSPKTLGMAEPSIIDTLNEQQDAVESVMPTQNEQFSEILNGLNQKIAELDSVMAAPPGALQIPVPADQNVSLISAIGAGLAAIGGDSKMLDGLVAEKRQIAGAQRAVAVENMKLQAQNDRFQFGVQRDNLIGLIDRRNNLLSVYEKINKGGKLEIDTDMIWEEINAGNQNPEALSSQQAAAMMEKLALSPSDVRDQERFMALANSKFRDGVEAQAVPDGVDFKNVQDALKGFNGSEILANKKTYQFALDSYKAAGGPGEPDQNQLAAFVDEAAVVPGLRQKVKGTPDIKFELEIDNSITENQASAAAKWGANKRVLSAITNSGAGNAEALADALRRGVTLGSSEVNSLLTIIEATDDKDFTQRSTKPETDKIEGRRVKDSLIRTLLNLRNLFDAKSGLAESFTAPGFIELYTGDTSIGGNN